MPLPTTHAAGDTILAADINAIAAAVNALDTNKLDTTAAAELIRDTIGAALVAGTNVTITVNDSADTITIAASGGGGGGSGMVVNVLGLLDVTKTCTGSISSNWFDGNRDYSNWANVGSGTQELVIDLGQEVTIDHLRWVLYWGDTRTYANVAVYASHDNFATQTTLRSPATYQPSTAGAAGLVISPGAAYRYLKFHSEGNSSNGNNEWVEFAVYAAL